MTTDTRLVVAAIVLGMVGASLLSVVDMRILLGILSLWYSAILFGAAKR